ncbi:MAG: hypothetical protein ACKO24_11740, partial [Leptolyngbyaceae cyanobacterium]
WGVLAEWKIPTTSWAVPCGKQLVNLLETVTTGVEQGTRPSTELNIKPAALGVGYKQRSP